MEDKMVELLHHTQQKLNIKAEVLCSGICTEEMYYMAINEKRFFDRVTIKRLIARMGLDNADYENYLHFPDYDGWLNRIRVINALESGKIDEAQTRIDSYLQVENNASKRNISNSREKIEKQFFIFMKLCATVGIYHYVTTQTSIKTTGIISLYSGRALEKTTGRDFTSAVEDYYHNAKGYAGTSTTMAIDDFTYWGYQYYRSN